MANLPESSRPAARDGSLLVQRLTAWSHCLESPRLKKADLGLADDADLGTFDVHNTIIIFLLPPQLGNVGLQHGLVELKEMPLPVRLNAQQPACTQRLNISFAITKSQKRSTAPQYAKA